MVEKAGEALRGVRHERNLVHRRQKSKQQNMCKLVKLTVLILKSTADIVPLQGSDYTGKNLAGIQKVISANHS